MVAVLSLAATGVTHAVGMVSTVKIESSKTHEPADVLAAPDGSVWYTTRHVARGTSPDTVGRIAPDGKQVVEAPLRSFGNPDNLTIGPDGAVWLTQGFEISRAVFDGLEIQTTTFRVTDGEQLGQVNSMTLGPDGNLWMAEAEPSGDLVWRYEVDANVFTAFPLGVNVFPRDIEAGPDGALWVAEEATTRPGAGSIARVSTDGVVTDRFAAAGNPTEIVTGPDGALWFIERFRGRRVGRITTDGEVSYPLLDPGLSDARVRVWEIAADPVHHRLYVTEHHRFDQLGAVIQIDLAGGVEPFPTATTGPEKKSLPFGVTVDANGDVWWAQFGVGRIAKLTVD
jgi:streptogramin lyase